MNTNCPICSRNLWPLSIVTGAQYQQREERELEQIAAWEKVNWARTRVEEEISRRILGKKLSQAVVDFIQHSWCMVMHLAHLRGGEAEVIGWRLSSCWQTWSIWRAASSPTAAISTIAMNC